MNLARSKFETRVIRVIGEQQKALAKAMIDHLPIDANRPVEIVAREPVRVRGLDANARMWVGPLKDIAEQAWFEGRQYSAEVLHEYFKKEYLPEDTLPLHELEELVKDPATWRKWEIDPSGDRVCVGSTTQLTKKGFSQYLTQIEAFGAGLGVQFSASPREQ